MRTETMSCWTCMECRYWRCTPIGSDATLGWCRKNKESHIFNHKACEKFKRRKKP